MHRRGDETIGERLRRLREERGLSQRDISERGISYAYISRIERGERDPSMKALRALARRLGVDAHYLETGEELPGALARDLKLGEAELTLRLDRDVVRAVRTFRGVLADALREGDPRDATRARIGLALTASHRGLHAEAVELLEAVVAEPWVRPATHPDVFMTLAHSYGASGRGDDGVEVLRSAVRELESRDPVDEPAVARFATYLSYALADIGDLDGARDAVATALEYARAADDPYTRVRLHWSNARLASLTGEYDIARISVNRAIALLQATEDTFHLARAHLLAAEIAAADGDDDATRAHLVDAADLVGPASELQDRAWLRIQEAFLAVRSGDVPGAIDAASEAIDMLGGDEDASFRGRAHWALAEALAAAGTTTAARAEFTRASDLLPPGSKYGDALMRAWTRVFPADAEVR